jgi:hypothetical protein
LLHAGKAGGVPRAHQGGADVVERVRPDVSKPESLGDGQALPADGNRFPVAARDHEESGELHEHGGLGSGRWCALEQFGRPPIVLDPPGALAGPPCQLAEHRLGLGC